MGKTRESELVSMEIWDIYLPPPVNSFTVRTLLAASSQKQ
jgi:hypothetical protein